MRWNPDWIDRLCINWAKQRRKALGIILPSQFSLREQLGKMNCTLGNLARSEEGQSSSYCGINQNWPEVYTGDSLIIHRCWNEMPGAWKEVMHVHYVWREIPVKKRAASIDLSVTTYYERLYNLKKHVGTYISIEKPYRVTKQEVKRNSYSFASFSPK